MNSAILAAALAFGIANADFAGDVSAVSSAANQLSGSAAAWNRDSGLQGALGIQGYFLTLSSAVSALAGDSVSDSEVDPATIIPFGASVASGLGILTAKAAYLKAIGADGIVAFDIKSIDDYAVKIVSNIVNAVSADNAKHDSLTSVLTQIANAFTSANSAFGLTPPAFPFA